MSAPVLQALHPPLPVRLNVLSMPDKTVYLPGEVFDASGISLEAVMNHGGTETVTDYAVSPSGALPEGLETVTLSLSVTGNSVSVSVPVTVERGVVQLPVQSSSLVYTGSELSPEWSGFDPDKLSISGATSAVNAGSYTAVFTPSAQYCWPDGSVTAKNVPWSISKAAGSLSIEPESLSLTAASPEASISVTRAGDGEISAVSADSSVAAATVSGSEVIVTAGDNAGEVQITISVAEGTNHLAPQSVSCQVSCVLAPAFADADWSFISQAASSGSAAGLWAVGDSKPVTLSGSIGSLDVDGLVLRAVILGFDHNHELEGSGRIHLQLGRSEADDADLCLVDSMYWQFTTGTGYFSPNYYGTSSGWADSQLRSVICAQVFNALPAELQAVIKPVTKYTNNTGGSAGDNADAITATTENVFLPSEFEVLGYSGSSSYYEADMQKQYAYFESGMNNVKYRHDTPDTAASWWTRSPSVTDGQYAAVDESGSSLSTYEFMSHGIAPCFCV